MRNRSVWLLCAGLLLVVACQVFDSPAYTDGQGNKHPEKKGIVSVIADIANGLGSAGVPWAGLGGAVLAVIGGAGAYLTDKKSKKDMQGIVQLFNRLKPELKNIMTDENLETFIMNNAPEGSPVGDALKRAWRAGKKEVLKRA